MQAAAPRHGRQHSARAAISFGVGRVLSASSRRSRLLQRQIAGGPDVGMAEAKQKVDVGGPGPDAVHRHQRGVRLVGGFLDQRGKIELAAVDGLGNGLERANFRRRKPGAGELGRTRAQHRRVIERIECLVEPLPDRFCARGRELLRDHDRGQSGEPVRPPPQGGPPRPRQHRAEARIGVHQTGDRDIEIGFGVNEKRHDRREASTNVIPTQPPSGCNPPARA